MLFATVSARGRGHDGKTVMAATRLHAWEDRSQPPRMLFETAEVPAPSFLAFAQESATLIVTSEMQGEGRASAFRVEDRTLAFTGSRTTNGNAGVHAALDGTGRWLAVANYRAEKAAGDAAVALFPVAASGEIGPLASSLAHAGTGPDPERQEGPHTHCVMFSPDNRLLAAIDLGTDGLWLYHFDPATGGARLAGEVKLPAGSRPRHCVFHPAKSLVYVCGELNSTLMTLRYDQVSGTAALIAATPATQAPHGERNYPSGIAISPDGRYLMLANRGADTIAVSWIDPETGIAHLREEVPCGGNFPRAIRLDRAGRVLAVANQKSGNIALFERDFESGGLTPMPHGGFDLPAAMDLIFLD